MGNTIAGVACGRYFENFLNASTPKICANTHISSRATVREPRKCLEKKKELLWKAQHKRNQRTRQAFLRVEKKKILSGPRK